MSDPAGQRHALVTGASKGIGRAIALALSQAGYAVIGTSRNPSALPRDEFRERIQWKPLDLSCEDSILKLLEDLPPLDILVNNAGSSQMGPIEEVPVDKMKALYQVVFFGPAKIIQGVLPAMRSRGQGIIINITSLAGLLPVPFAAVYASAKSALNVLSFGLRQEVAVHGIHVVALAPSYMHTGIQQETLCLPHSPYKANLDQAKETRDRGIERGGAPDAVARRVLQILRSHAPKPFYVAGPYASILCGLHRLLPAAWLEQILRNRFGISHAAPVAGEA